MLRIGTPRGLWQDTQRKPCQQDNGRNGPPTPETAQRETEPSRLEAALFGPSAALHRTFALLLCPRIPTPFRVNSMNIHEYQAKEVLRGFGVPVPKGKAAFSVEEAVAAAKELGGPVWVVKAQIHAGGRGKGGGVKVV